LVTVNLPGPPTAQPLPAGTQLQYITSDSTFPIVLDNYLLNATLTIPISDYFLRVNKNATAATHSEEAARYDVLAARAKSFSDGRNAYYTWLRARGAQTVAEQTLVVAQAHLRDAQSLFAVGNASKADVLRAETAVAAADLVLAKAKGLVIVTEKQVRIAMHAPDEEVLAPGEALDAPLPPAPSDVKALVPEALAKRPEIKSAERNAEASRKLASVQRAGRYPAVSAFGDLTYANPNARKFPTTQEWFPTWFIGAQVTWSPSDALTAAAGSTDFEARAAALDAQRAVISDGIEVEVVQAYEDMVAADIGLTTTARQLDSAVEGYRVARELFNLGRNTSTALIDAETALTQSRFDHLNARVDARTARVRLDHALGRDARGGP
jgi:outer membrane protein TolC